MVFGRTGTFVILNLFQETQTYIWRRNIVIIISQYWDGTEGWNPSWKRGTHISTTVNTVVVDDLNPCVARASAAMTLTYFSPNIPMIRFRAQLFRFHSKNYIKIICLCFWQSYLAKHMSVNLYKCIAVTKPKRGYCTGHNFVVKAKVLCVLEFV